LRNLIMRQTALLQANGKVYTPIRTISNAPLAAQAGAIFHGDGLRWSVLPIKYARYAGCPALPAQATALLDRGLPGPLTPPSCIFSWYLRFDPAP
jgi:hypothetical protein